MISDYALQAQQEDDKELDRLYWEHDCTRPPDDGCSGCEDYARRHPDWGAQGDFEAQERREQELEDA